MARSRINRLASVFTTNATKTAGPFTAVAGDLFLVKVLSEDGANTTNTPTGLTGATWTQRVNVGAAGTSARLTFLTAVAASSGSFTISVGMTNGAGVGRFGIEVVQWRDATIGQVWSGVINTGSGAPSAAATPQAANSAIETAFIDYLATATTGKAYLTSDAGAFTESASAQTAGFTYYLGYHANSGVQASKTVGMSAPTTQRWSLGAVEIKDTVTATTYDRSAAIVSAQAPSGSVARTREQLRTGASVTTLAPSASRSIINPTTYHGTAAVGRIQPVRSGSTSTESKPSASRSVSTATAYTRSGSTVSALAPSASRSVTPIGITRTRSATIAVGRIPVIRAGATVVSTALSGSRILGNPGASFDRTGSVVTGRIAQSRNASTTSEIKLSGSVNVTPHGTIDRNGGGAGGAGQPAGLLLSLQVHPGATLSASRRVDSNVPLRTALIVSRPVTSGVVDVDRPRSGAIVAVNALSGSRVSSGNRNRNGLIRSQAAPSAGVQRVTLSQRNAAIASGATISGSYDVGLTPIYVRGGAVVTRHLVSGRRIVRLSATKTYVFPPITTGWVSSPEENGVVVA